jgi:hypothetical protein
MAKAKAGWIGLSVLVASLPATAWGQAASFGRAGQFAVSGERLVGLFVHHVETDLHSTTTIGGGPGGGVTATVDANSETDATEFVVLGNSDQAGPAGIPRAAFDFFVIDGLSLGGAVLFENHSAEADTTGTGTVGGGPSQSIDRTQVETSTQVWGFAPRIGYAYMFTPVVGIWPRGGISYVVANTEENERVTDSQDGSVQTTDTETTIKHLAFTLDAMLVLSPIEHVGFGVGPFVEFPLSGDIEANSTQVNPDVRSDSDGDVKVTSYGISSSVFVWFP